MVFVGDVIPRLSASAWITRWSTCFFFLFFYVWFRVWIIHFHALLIVSLKLKLIFPVVCLSICPRRWTTRRFVYNIWRMRGIKMVTVKEAEQKQYRDYRQDLCDKDMISFLIPLSDYQWWQRREQNGFEFIRTEPDQVRSDNRSL